MMMTLSFVLALGAATPAPAALDRSAPPKPEAPKAFTIQQPVSFKLKNGMRVLLVERKRAPLVDIVASVQAGATAESIEQAGLASHVASMLTEGAGDLDAIAFSDAVEGLGATINGEGHVDHATLSLHTTSARLQDALRLFALALTKPRFDEKEWKRVQAQTFGYYMYQSQEPQELSTLAGARALWGDKHRLGWSVLGTPRSLLKIGVQDLRGFHTARYRPDTTTLIVVGDVNKKEITAALESAFAGWSAKGPTPPAPKLAPPVLRDKRALITLNVPDAPQTVLRVGSAGPRDLAPYTADVEVMNTLLGGSFTSRLNNNLREQHGYSYGAGSRVIISRTGSLFVVRTSVATPVTAPALNEIIVELERILTLASSEEVERARNLTALSLPSRFDNGRATAQVWADVVALNTDPKRLQSFMAAAPKVSAAAIQKAAKRIVKPNNLVFVAVGDVDELAGDKLGPKTALSIDDVLPGLAEAGAALGGGSQEAP